MYPDSHSPTLPCCYYISPLSALQNQNAGENITELYHTEGIKFNKLWSLTPIQASWKLWTALGGKKMLLFLIEICIINDSEEAKDLIQKWHAAFVAVAIKKKSFKEKKKLKYFK